MMLLTSTVRVAVVGALIAISGVVIWHLRSHWTSTIVSELHEVWGGMRMELERESKARDDQVRTLYCEECVTTYIGLLERGHAMKRGWRERTRFL